MTQRQTSTGRSLKIVEPPPDPAGRVPPHDLGAEAAVLSAIMLDRGALVLVLDMLKPDHFYSLANGRVYQAIQTLAAASAAIDLVSVSSWLRDRQWLDKMGGTAYLAQIIDATPAVMNVGTHARIVRDKWRLRQLIATCQRVAAEGYDDVGEVQTFINGAESSIADLGRAGVGDDLERYSIGAIAAESAAETVALQSPFAGAFISTGVQPIDDVTGLYQNEVTLLGAPKGLGKTTLARFIVDRVVHTPRRLIDGKAGCEKCQAEQPCSPEHGRQPRGVLVLALEGTRRDWSDYGAAKAARLNLFDRRHGRWSTDDAANFMHHLELLRRVPLAVDDRKDLNRANIAARIRAWRDWFARKGAVLELVVLDYFQIAAWERGKDSRESDLNDAGRHLIRLATDAESDLRGLAWLVISALNKDGGTRESGALEYHCDTFWRLSEGKEAGYGDEKSLRMWIEKQRRGPSKIGVNFFFDPAMGVFR